MNPKVAAVVDLQFGSTGKGSMAGYLSLHGYNGLEFTAAVTNWGPNAGHTTVYPDGVKIVRTMLANSAHRGSVQRVYVGPGSAINRAALIEETLDSARANHGLQVFVHERAPVVLPGDAMAEKRHNRIGSTQKGTADAWIAKMERDPDDTTTLAINYGNEMWADSGGVIVVLSHAEYMQRLYSEPAVLAEGCQGYSLGYSSGFWPYVTARECTVAQLLSDTLLPPKSLVGVIGCARTFPIRVANRFDAEGRMVGFSGPHYPDQEETAFDKIGQPTEFTTVTKLPRRIFTFSDEQFTQAVMANGVTDVFLNFLNYVQGWTPQREFVARVEGLMNKQNVLDNGVRYLGVGPSITEIIDRNGKARP